MEDLTPPIIDSAAVAFDIDGVFADTMSLFLEIAREEFHQTGLRYEDITSYALEACLDLEAGVLPQIIDQILSGRHRIALQPIDDAPQVVDRLIRRHGAALFVTARPDAEFITAWMQGVMAAPNGVRVVATGAFDAKAAVLKDHGRQWFVEDRLETCFLLAEAGIQPVVYRQPWNRSAHPFLEVGSWRELAVLMGLEARPAP